MSVVLPKLVHYSEKPLGKLRSVSQVDTPEPKPNGLWVSDDAGFGWKEWCTGEDWSTQDLNHCSEVVIADPSRVLWLKSGYDIDAFTVEYAADFHGLSSWGIDWKKVAKEYGGILITPYQWSRRLHQDTKWYYGWDCASGCIWDASLIAEIRVTA